MVALADPQKVYWDSCVWLALINREDKADACDYIVEKARRGEVQIWTSTLTLAEVYKAKCENNNPGLMANKDADFVAFLEQSFVYEVQLDHDIATLARMLCRTHPILKKPNDGIHLATAIAHNLDYFYSYDRDDLTRLNGQIFRRDLKPLPIGFPPNRPPPTPPPTEKPNPQHPLFGASD